MNTNPRAKRILCFGDSLTWGYIPGSYPEIKRFGPKERCPGILQDLLGDEYEVIEEGMHGRTIDLDDPKAKENKNRLGRNGLEYLTPCLKTHQPIDVIIVILGTNDLKGRYKKHAQDMVNSYEKIINMINDLKYEVQDKPPKIILIPPVNIDYIKAEKFRGYRENTLKIVDEVFDLLKKAELENTEILDLRDKVKTGIDGLHLDAFSQKKVAEILMKSLLAS
jgi:lysophospholipase L1-like esterase